MALPGFHPLVSQWFTDTLGAPTPAQERGWAAIRARQHTLIAAPTGSGKTLAAFLTAIDELVHEGSTAPLPDEVRVVYVSPLKALSADIHKNLAEPRLGIRRLAQAQGVPVPHITAAVRTGDTTSAERAAMLRTPPHILVTTPESLYLLLTSEGGRGALRTVRAVIVDEIHAVIGTRRGAHLALSLERLQHIAERPLLRIGLSATQKPVEEVARFLVGADPRRGECTIVDEGHRREMEIAIETPRSPLEAVMSNETWEDYYDRLTELVSAHRTTLVFVNTRRMAERVARHLSDRLGDATVTAHHGSLSKETRLRAESLLKAGQLKALVATASLELGIDIGSVDLVCQIGSPHRIATMLQRIGRSGHGIGRVPRGRVFPVSRDDLVECAALLRAIHRGELDAIVAQDAPLDVLAQQVVAESACDEWAESDLYAVFTRAWPYRHLERTHFDAVLGMVAEGYATRRGRRAALLHRDEVHAMLRGRRGSRMLALTSGGAIPELADYRVVLEPDETFVGTLNEDFAIESLAGDIFQLGNASWEIKQVVGGTVRVVDAHGAPPTIPFWLGEAPARSDELSVAVSQLRADIERQLIAQGDTGGAADASSPADSSSAVAAWLEADAGIEVSAAEQIVDYIADGRRTLGVVPTQETLVLERFFDESGGMQLVLHAPFGSRLNRAWALALRKRFCRQFNFELQAAATEDALLLSLGPQHSFPLADVFRYLHVDTVRDILVQAMLDAPLFQTRWRWNTTVSLAVPRARGGKKVAPQLQRMLADDLMAAVFPDAAACLENIPGDREIPDHPLVNQTVRDCLDEAMDLAGLQAVLRRIHAGTLRCVSRDTPEPSTFAHDILNARPYAFLDDAPLEERRTHAVQMRRASEPGNDTGALDASAIERVRDEARPDPRDVDELHDALLTTGVLLERELPAELSAPLAIAGRATRVVARPRSSDGPDAVLWVAAERLPEVLAIHPGATLTPVITAPPARAARTWSREDAMTEIVRGRLAIMGPTTASALASDLALDESEIDGALLALEADGAVLRGTFTPGSRALQWCDRRLLARIHRYTLNRLRAEIAPVTAAEFMRFLFTWQHVHSTTRLTGVEGLRTVLSQLDGLELPARAWERDVLPLRVEGYEPSQLDMLCLTGEISWGKLAAPGRSRGDELVPLTQVVGATPIALFLRAHASAWHTLRMSAIEERSAAAAASDDIVALSDAAQRLLEMLRTRGASFAHELQTASGLVEEQCRSALAELVAAGLAASDGFAGLRAMIGAQTGWPTRGGRIDSAGRWSATMTELEEQPPAGDAAPARGRDSAIEMLAWTLLARYGVVFKRLLARETRWITWRELVRVYRRLEARGEIRGGRFVSGMSGEQFALPQAVDALREVRRATADDRLITISAADPLNLTGIVTVGERIRTSTGSRVVYRNGIPVAALEGELLRMLAEVAPEIAPSVAAAAAGRRVPVVAGYVGRPS